MPNPEGINQYTRGGAGGDKSHEKTGRGNAHPSHPRTAAEKHADLMKSARQEGFSVKGHIHDDR